MKKMRTLLGLALAVGAALSMTAPAFASDYSFATTAPQDYYGSTSYEDVYGAQYNYGIGDEGSSPLTKLVIDGSGGSGPVITPTTPTVQQPIYTSVPGMVRADGSIGTLSIPKLGISVKVWEGETNASMAKGVGHYSSTSGWQGNIGLCGHNRGARYNIGTIKNLKPGDIITYTTIYGTRTYEVTMVKTISNTDWSYLQGTADNRITITTCLENQPAKRICVQAVEKSS